MVSNALKFYIGGQWVDPVGRQTIDVVNPATEKPIATVALANTEDVDKAVAAARRAFDTFSQTTQAERIGLLERIVLEYALRSEDLARVLCNEMGAPIGLAENAQIPAGLAQLSFSLEALRNFEFGQNVGTSRVVREPIGVCGLITPWNWPLNQIMAKVGPAIAAGCTVILKPSEIAPLSALICAEIMHDAGVPEGVFNLINGDGPTAGQAMSTHPQIDMISITGSTRAGISVAERAASSVKRVAQELGGKSANIILDDLDDECFQQAVSRDAVGVFINSGQSCNAPTRMLVPESRMDEAAEIAKAAAEKLIVGDPLDPTTEVGPLVSKAQYDKVCALIQKGVEQGAKLVTGGPFRSISNGEGYYVDPTVFSHVKNDMDIAEQEIFGPVLSLIGFQDEEDAIRIANATDYGLSAYVSSRSLERAKSVGAKLRAGNVHLNGAGVDFGVPFGGYKQSGNGREFGEWGLEEFLETKSFLGFNKP